MNGTDRSEDTERSKKQKEKYEKIIGLPRHQSQKRKRMDIKDRAAQFASFQALSGFSDDIEETARLTENRDFVTEEREYVINEALNKLIEVINKKPFAEITYFKEDGKKQGGAYIVYKGNLRAYNEVKKSLIFTDNTEILLDDICDVCLYRSI